MLNGGTKNTVCFHLLFYGTPFILKLTPCRNCKVAGSSFKGYMYLHLCLAERGEGISLSVALTEMRHLLFQKSLENLSLVHWPELGCVAWTKHYGQGNGIFWLGLANQSLSLCFQSGHLFQSTRAAGRGMVPLPFHPYPQIHSLLCSTPSGPNFSEWITPAVLLPSF